MTLADANLQRMRQERDTYARRVSRLEDELRAAKAGVLKETLMSLYPALPVLLERLEDLAYAADPGPATGSVGSTRGHKRDAYPEPGRSNRWLRRRQYRANRRLGVLVDDITEWLSRDEEIGN